MKGINFVLKPSEGFFGYHLADPLFPFFFSQTSFWTQNILKHGDAHGKIRVCSPVLELGTSSTHIYSNISFRR